MSSLQELEEYLHQYESQGKQRKKISRESYGGGALKTRTTNTFKNSVQLSPPSSSGSMYQNPSRSLDNTSILIKLESFLTKLDNFKSMRAYRMKQLQQECLKEFDTENEFGESVLLCNNEEKGITEEEYETLLFGGQDTVEEISKNKEYSNIINTSLNDTNIDSAQASMLMKSEWDIPLLSNTSTKQRIQFLKDSISNVLHSSHSVPSNLTVPHTMPITSSSTTTSYSQQGEATRPITTNTTHSNANKPPVSSSGSSRIRKSNTNILSMEGISFETLASTTLLLTPEKETNTQQHPSVSSSPSDELTAYLNSLHVPVSYLQETTESKAEHSSEEDEEDVDDSIVHLHMKNQSPRESNEVKEQSKIDLSQQRLGESRQNSLMDKYLTKARITSEDNNNNIDEGVPLDYPFLSKDLKTWLTTNDDEEDDDADDFHPRNMRQQSSSLSSAISSMKTVPSQHYYTLKEQILSPSKESTKSKDKATESTVQSVDDSMVINRLNRVLFTSTQSANDSFISATIRSPPPSGRGLPPRSRKEVGLSRSAKLSPKPITPQKIPDFED